jgi:hypothetical protein
MAHWIPQRNRSAWDAELADRLLAVSDREAVLAECYCPACKRRLVVKPRMHEFMAGVALTVVSDLECPRCTFQAAVGCHEIYLYDWGRLVTIDGHVVREVAWDSSKLTRLSITISSELGCF